MLLLIYLTLCVVFSLPWYAYLIGVFVWILSLGAR
jgi:hypothetical protein